MLIVGEKESENTQVSVRQRGVGDLGSMTIDVFASLVQKTIDDELATNV
jgi:threonyl-tRNA synthetase